MGDDEGGETEIGFRLAATGREKQQIRDLPIRVPPIGEPREVQKDKGLILGIRMLTK